MNEENKRLKNNEQSIDAEERLSKIEKFLLNPDEVIFEILSKFEELLPVLDKLNNKDLKIIKGEDGKTPQMGIDYLTPEELDQLEEFINDKIPKLGVDVPTIEQAYNFIQKEVNKIPKPKDGKTPTKEELQVLVKDAISDIKDELKGKDGSPDSPEDIVKKLRSLGKNQKLKVKDIRGLDNLIKKLQIQFNDKYKEIEQNITLIQNSQTSATGSTTFTDLTDTPTDYSGSANKGIRVKSDESGLEFYDIQGGTDEMVKASQDDTEAGYLDAKVDGDTIIVEDNKLKVKDDVYKTSNLYDNDGQLSDNRTIDLNNKDIAFLNDDNEIIRYNAITKKVILGGDGIKITSSISSNGKVLTAIDENGNAEWRDLPEGSADELVKIDSNDNSTGYLSDKLLSGQAISLSIVADDNNNKHYEVNVNYDSNTLEITDDKLNVKSQSIGWLNDIDINNIQEGDILVYQNGKWVNGTIPQKQKDIFKNQTGNTISLSQIPNSDPVDVYLNGQLLTETDDYTISGQDISFTNDLIDTDIVSVIYNI